MFKRFAIALSLLIGCTADLQKVHTPDLLNVTGPPGRLPNTLKATGRTPAVPPKADWRIYTTLIPWEDFIDDDPATAAAALEPQSKDQFVLIDLGRVCRVQSIRQLHPGGSGFPVRYRIDAAGDHNFPYTLIHLGVGADGESIAALPQPVACRFLRITLIEPGDHPWALAELDVN